jgi:hypothetical protein
VGLSLRNIGRKITDVFDANSAADQQKRIAAGQPRFYADQQRALGNKRPNQNLGTAILGNTARLGNTLSSYGQQLPDTIRQATAAATHNPAAFTAASLRLKNVQNRTLDPNSGILGAGTIFDSPEQYNKASTGDILKRGGGSYLGAVGELAPLPATKAIQGASLGSKVAKVGLASAAANTAANTGSQIIETGRIDPRQTAVAAVTGGALGAATPVAAALTRGGARVAARQLDTLGEEGFAKVPTKVTAKAPKATVKAKATGEPVLLGRAKTYTGAPKAPNPLDRAWMSTTGVISRHGKGGTELSRRIQEARNQSEVGQEAFIDSIPKVRGLKGDDFTSFVQSLERLSNGKKVKVAPHIAEAIGEWNKAIPTVRDRAVKAGLDVGDLGPNYFPRQYKAIADNKGLSKVADDMVKQGKATDLGDAMSKLEFMRNEYQRPFGNLERTRDVDLPGYEQTPEALSNYVSRSYDRISKAEQLGAKNERLNQLRAIMQNEGYDATPGSIVDKYIKIALGDVDKSTTGHKVSGKIRQFNALRSLSAAGVSNATQLVNTATIAGAGRTAKGVVRAATSPEARAKAQASGVLLDHSINTLAKQGLGVSGKITSNVASPFFRQVERFNRQTTAIVGADYGNKLAAQAAKGNQRALQQLTDKFGVTGTIGKKLTPEQETQVARKLTELAQFKVDPMDLPGWVDSPMGKLVAQFRTFGYKQTGFVYNQVLREAMKGNLLPLTRFVALAVPAGGAALETRGLIKGTNPYEEDESNVSKAVQNISALGGGGLPASEINNLITSTGYDNLLGGAASTVGGPTLGFTAETLGNAQKAIKGNTKPLKKEGVRSIPAVGPSIANRVYPKKDDPKAVSEAALPTATPEQISATAKQEKADFMANAKKSGGALLDKLSNGKYVVGIDGKVSEFKTLNDARKAIAKEDFRKSDAKKKIVGDTVYLKKKDGSVKTQDKVLYEYDQSAASNNLEMDRAYEAKDVGRYLTAAQKQLDALEKKKAYYDPETDQDEIDKITLQEENLIDKAQGYAAKGIGGKGGSSGGGGGGSGGSGSAGSDYKYAVSANAGGSIARPTVTARRTNAPKSRSKTPLGKPKVTLKAART